MKIITSMEMALKNPNAARFLKLKLKDKLPPEIAELPVLEELYLEGEFPQVYLDLSSLKHLRAVFIKSPNLNTFPADVLKAPMLSNLKIISGTFKQLRLPLEILSPLKSLTIKDSQLQVLPLEFSQFENLTELNLSGNCLTELPETLSDLKNLRRLNIDGNRLEKLSSVIKDCPALRHLSCDGNLFSEEEKFRIQREFNISPN